MSDKKPFAEPISNGCKLRVGSMTVAAEYSDQAEATAARIEADHARAVLVAQAEALEKTADWIMSQTEQHPINGTPQCPTGGRYCEHMQGFCGCEDTAKMLRSRAAALRAEAGKNPPAEAKAS